ncbi:hypothetical protein BDQ12DRAFT_682835 [Crucibulum laeve]|uniref:Uncharacterized protein n=1 Tax=Crucibulum laeve TaxID=68775 RepID=A0A5C3M3Q0_9AGAR|nr:hypothetical protein BDQ12DRAFT_682835 [Crucibulum laeve]
MGVILNVDRHSTSASVACLSFIAKLVILSALSRICAFKFSQPAAMGQILRVQMEV